MNTALKNFAIRTLTVSALLAATLTSAQAGVFIRTGVFVAPVYAAPVYAAPVAVVAPVVVAPVAVYVPTCRFVAVPVMNAWTGITYMVTRRVCN